MPPDVKVQKASHGICVALQIQAAKLSLHCDSLRFCFPA